MLTHSFIFANGMNEDFERKLWERGVLNWDILRKHPGEAADAIGDARARKLQVAVTEAASALEAQDSLWFKSNWPSNQTWRLWRGFCDQTANALVDIETTGRTPGFDQITVIGLSDGNTERAFVADRAIQPDEPLDDFLEVIKQFQLLVTFNGIGFDVPFIEKSFRAQSFSFAVPHIDLMLVARSIGMKGGLKDMEKQAGIARDDDIADMRGNEAITLWGQWKNGDRAAYDKLVTYCKADCTNLAAFADYLYQAKWSQTYEPYAKDIDLDAAHGEQLSLF